ncbi:MAG: CvpA family protein [Lachnospiraceae bacterium]|nr:CvpA family protein [Lachnospiraceae bacterium]
MSAFSMIVAVWWLIIAVRGFRRGLVRTAISMVSVLLIMTIVSGISPLVSDVLEKQTVIKVKIEEKCEAALEDVLQGRTEPGKSEQISIIEELPIPMLLKEELLENNNRVIYDMLSVDTFAGYLAAFLASAIVQILVFLISFIAASIILKVITNILDLFANLPILGGINRLGGFMLGIISGLLYLWVFFLLITLFGGTEVGAYLLKEIAGDKLLDYLYENNLLMQFLMSVLI